MLKSIPLWFQKQSDKCYIIPKKPPLKYLHQASIQAEFVHVGLILNINESILMPIEFKVYLKVSLLTFFFFNRSADLKIISGVISTSNGTYFSLYKIWLFSMRSFYHWTYLKMWWFFFVLLEFSPPHFWVLF